MPVSADGLASLMGLGLAGETLLAVVRVMDAEQARTCGFVATVAADAVAAPARSAAALRQERYRLKKQAEAEGVTGGDADRVMSCDAETVTNTHSVTDEASLSPSSVMPVGDLFSPSSPSLPVLPSPPKRYNQTPFSNLPIPSTPPTLDAPAARRLRESGAGQIFDEQFWPAYPRRTGSNSKAAAKVKFIRLAVGGINPQAMIDGVKAYATSRIGEDPRFTMQTTRWLNERHWEDDLSPPPGAARPATRGPANPFSEIMATIDFNNVGQRDAGHEYGSDPLAIEYRRD